FRLRELTLRAPLPESIFGDFRATLVFSGRNFWTWKNEDFLVFDPEMTGDQGMHTVIRRIDSHVPAPATFVMSLRVTR
ncbi:MAG TPA: hypothetical protein VMN39_02935, partial [Longimicrobiaceae bacterium]|nr:hypothetical protein [Longimicrobiaceae bacterium]